MIKENTYYLIPHMPIQKNKSDISCLNMAWGTQAGVGGQERPLWLLEEDRLDCLALQQAF